MIDINPERTTRLLYRVDSELLHEVHTIKQICRLDGTEVEPWDQFGMCQRNSAVVGLVGAALRVRFDVVGPADAIFSTRGIKFQLAMLQVHDNELKLHYGSTRLLTAVFDHVFDGQYRGQLTFSFRDGVRDLSESLH